MSLTDFNVLQYVRQFAPIIISERVVHDRETLSSYRLITAISINVMVQPDVMLLGVH